MNPQSLPDRPEVAGAEPVKRKSPVRLIIVLVIVLRVFGGSQLPKLARSLGQAQKEFKSGLAEGSKDEDTTTKGDSTNK